MKKLILKLAVTTLVLLWAFSLGNTQESRAIVMGNAYDSESFQPVAEGIVYCKQNPSISTTTGLEGDYVISVPLKTNVCCSKENYETAESETILSTGTHYWDPEMVSSSSN